MWCTFRIETLSPRLPLCSLHLIKIKRKLFAFQPFLEIPVQNWPIYCIPRYKKIIEEFLWFFFSIFLYLFSCAFAVEYHEFDGWVEYVLVDETCRIDSLLFKRVWTLVFLNKHFRHISVSYNCSEVGLSTVLIPWTVRACRFQTPPWTPVYTWSCRKLARFNDSRP